MALCFAAPLGRKQQSQKIDPRLLIKGIHLDQPPQERELSLRVRFMAASQLPQQLDMEAPKIFPLGQAPGLEFVAVGQIKPLEKIALKELQGFEKSLAFHRIEPAAVDGAQPQKINGTAAVIQFHLLAVGDEAAISAFLEGRSQAAQAPAQGAPGIVRNFPEKTAKPLTPLRPCRRGEVGQKGTRLSRGRKLDPVTSAPNLHLSQKAQRETSACHCHGWSLFRWLYPNSALMGNLEVRRI